MMRTRKRAVEAAPIAKVTTPAPRARAQEIDRHIGARLRQRRVMLGLTQQQLAEAIGVTYQQGHKYEKGTNRVSAGRLHALARALAVEPGYFYEGFGAGGAVLATGELRLLLGMTERFVTLPRPQQEAITAMVRALAGADADEAAPVTLAEAA